MFDSRTKKRIVFAAEPDAPIVFVSKDQTSCVADMLERADIRCQIEMDALRENGEPVADAIRVLPSQRQEAQRLLDEAVVRVSIHLVNGECQEFYEGHEFIERYEDLARRGLTGKQLVNSLISDDWGAPPSLVVLEGHDESRGKLRVNIPYK